MVRPILWPQARLRYLKRDPSVRRFAAQSGLRAAEAPGHDAPHRRIAEAAILDQAPVRCAGEARPGCSCARRTVVDGIRDGRHEVAVVPGACTGRIAAARALEHGAAGP